MTAHLLLVEDDADLARMVSRFLQRQGFSVEVLRSGEGAADRILRINPDLLILDLMLPGVSGLDICAQVRPHFAGQILMLTALSEDVDQIAGLNRGADDYLAKPVKPDLLLARVQALLRRAERYQPQPTDTLKCGKLTITTANQAASYDGKQVELGSGEFELLLYLARHRGEVLSRDRLYQAVYQTQYDGQDRSLDLMVSRLRRKFAHAGDLIRTVRGKGYLLAEGAQ